MPKRSDLPQSEFEVMDVLWHKGEATIKEIHAELSAQKKLAYTTVATLLNRLREKGYVEAEERNFAYVFHALVTREHVQTRKLDDLVQRVLHGNVGPLAAYITQNRELTEEQIAALREIIESSSEESPLRPLTTAPQSLPVSPRREGKCPAFSEEDKSSE